MVFQYPVIHSGSCHYWNCPSYFYHCEGNSQNLGLALRVTPRWAAQKTTAPGGTAERLHAGGRCGHPGPAGTKILVSPALGQPPLIPQGCTSAWACSVCLGEDRQAPSSLALEPQTQALGCHCLWGNLPNNPIRSCLSLGLIQMEPSQFTSVVLGGSDHLLHRRNH